MVLGARGPGFPGEVVAWPRSTPNNVHASDNNCVHLMCIGRHLHVSGTCLTPCTSADMRIEVNAHLVRCALLRACARQDNYP